MNIFTGIFDRIRNGQILLVIFWSDRAILTTAQGLLLIIRPGSPKKAKSILQKTGLYIGQFLGKFLELQHGQRNVHGDKLAISLQPLAVAEF